MLVSCLKWQFGARVRMLRCRFFGCCSLVGQFTVLNLLIAPVWAKTVHVYWLGTVDRPCPFEG